VSWLKRLDAIIDTVYFAFTCAVPLAVLAFAVQKLGWNAVVVALPLFCAFHAGRRLALDQWTRELDARLEALKRKLPPEDPKR